MNEDKQEQSKYGHLKDLKDHDFIGTYGTPNTYNANLPENVRNKKCRPDCSRRCAHVNPNCSWG